MSGYKKCPFCDLNYIKEDEVCCDICYKESIEAQKACKAFEIKRLKGRKDINELKNRDQLLDAFEEFGFIGFLHTTNFNNFVKIYKSRFLKSRQQLIDENVAFEDNAENAIIDKTPNNIKNKVRFYLRPITPTNISAYMNHNQKHPVMLVFEKALIYREDIIFCDGCAMAQNTKKTSLAEEALDFDWESIFSKGYFVSENFILKNRRNAECCFSLPICTSLLSKVIFKEYEDYNKAIELFGKKEKFVIDKSCFYEESGYVGVF